MSTNTDVPKSIQKLLGYTKKEIFHNLDEHARKTILFTLLKYLKNNNTLDALKITSPPENTSPDELFKFCFWGKQKYDEYKKQYKMYEKAAEEAKAAKASTKLGGGAQPIRKSKREKKPSTWKTDIENYYSDDHVTETVTDEEEEDSANWESSSESEAEDETGTAEEESVKRGMKAKQKKGDDDFVPEEDSYDDDEIDEHGGTEDLVDCVDTCLGKGEPGLQNCLQNKCKVCDDMPATGRQSPVSRSRASHAPKSRSRKSHAPKSRSRVSHVPRPKSRYLDDLDDVDSDDVDSDNVDIDEVNASTSGYFDSDEDD